MSSIKLEKENEADRGEERRIREGGNGKGKMKEKRREKGKKKRRGRKEGMLFQEIHLGARLCFLKWLQPCPSSRLLFQQ